MTIICQLSGGGGKTKAKNKKDNKNLWEAKMFEVGLGSSLVVYLKLELIPIG